MSAPGPTLEILGRVAYQMSVLQPYLLTHIHLIVSALFPIYTGAHASLSRPKSAAVPPKNKTENEESSDETEQQMEGLTPADAILYPILTGCMLGGLYFLIKWLQDPTILNKILNAYLSIFGALSIARLLVDSMENAITLIFPTKYVDRGVMWEVKRKQRRAYPRRTGAVRPQSQNHTSSPFPGVFSRLYLPEKAKEAGWTLRDFLALPLCTIETGIRSNSLTLPLKPQGFLGLFGALFAVLYYNFIDNPWWLTNLLGFSFSYGALQIISPTTCWTGTLVLTSLFFYDIYFVFFTPLMMTVATQLDIPAKLLFPRPPGVDDDPSKKALSMLGLGDVVIPGMMIGFALRFDLYLFYLRKQTHRIHKTTNLQKVEEHDGESIRPETSCKDDIIKSQYRSASGGWGDRFWIGLNSSDYIDGGKFAKTYFYASIVGYVIGMLCTLGVMHIYKHGQPALLYLVPGVLGSLWGTAFVKGDIKTLWNYTEADEEDNSKGKGAPKSMIGKEAATNTKEDSKASSKTKSEDDAVPLKDTSDKQSESRLHSVRTYKFRSFWIKFSGPSHDNPMVEPKDFRPKARPEDDLPPVSEEAIEEHRFLTVEDPPGSHHPPRSADEVENGPAEKRQRRG